jgi:hypothetical protein
MADAGVPVHVLRTIAGHGSLTTTPRYLHPDRRSVTAAGDALSAYLRTPRSPMIPKHERSRSRPAWRPHQRLIATKSESPW